MGAKKIDIAEQSEELRKLILENPDLPIVVVVDSEVVADDNYCWWYANEIRYNIQTLLMYDTYYGDCRLLDDVGDLEEVIANDLTYDDEYENLPDEEFDAIVQEKVMECEPLWTKCIVISATT